MATKKTEEKGVDKPSVNFMKKISTPKVMGRKMVSRDLKEGDNDLYQVVGIASGRKTGETDYGEWVCLTGQFAATNLETGEQSRAGQCFLPDVAIDPVIGQLDAGAQAVEFGYTIGVKIDDSVPVGYVYYAKPLIEPDENDPLEQLAGKMEAPKALEDKSSSK